MLSFGSLVLLSVGGYWLWKQQAPIAGTIPEISRTSGIQLYQTMQDVQNVPKGVFSYASALSFAPIVERGMNEAINQAYPQFYLRYGELPFDRNPGSTTAIRLLIDGEVSIAQSARPLEEAEFNRARERDFRLEQIPIAIDGIVVYAHPDIAIPGLSHNQLQDIYSGKITNWKALGGPNLSIVPFSLDPKATASPKQVLGDAANRLPQNVQILQNAAEGIRRVATTPGAIAFSGAPNVVGQPSIRILNVAKANSDRYVSPITEGGIVNSSAFRDGTYPLTRRSFIIIRRDGSLDEQAGIAYANFLLSKEGQRIIAAAGSVPLVPIH